MDTQQTPQGKKTYTTLIALVLMVVIALVGYKIWTGGGIHADKQELTEDHINNMTFNGIVTDFKYDDNKAHTKIALLSDGTRYAIYPQWVYDIDAGDTLVKKKGNMQIEVHKPHGKIETLDYWPIIRKLELTGRL